MNQPTETADASSYNVTRYLDFPIDGIPRAVDQLQQLACCTGQLVPWLLVLPDELGVETDFTVDCMLSHSLVDSFHQWYRLGNSLLRRVSETKISVDLIDGTIISSRHMRNRLWR